MYRKCKLSTEANEEVKLVDEKTAENITADDALDDYFSTGDDKSNVDDSSDIELYDDFEDMCEIINVDSPVTKVTDEFDSLESEMLIQSNNINNVPLNDTNVKTSSDVHALDEEDVDMKSVGSNEDSHPDNTFALKADTTNILHELDNILLNFEKHAVREEKTERLTHEEPVKRCMCNSRNVDKDSIDKETQTSLSMPTDSAEYINENIVLKEISQSCNLTKPSTSKSNLKNAESVDNQISEDDLPDFDNADDLLSVGSNRDNENIKYNSPDEWDQLQQDIYNLRQVLENELMNSFANKTENVDHYKNLKRYKADFDKLDSNNDSFVKTIKIVPLNYPNESIDKKTVARIHNLILEAVSETELPLIKCHGVKDNALVYTCFTQDSYKFLNKLLINTKTKIMDALIDERKPRVFMRFFNYLELSFNQILSKIQLYHKDIITKNWKVEHNWDNDNVTVFILEIDEDSFEIIKNNGFCLFFGPDQAEFSVAWL